MTGPHWNAETLCQRLEPLCPGIGVEVVVATGSTSTDLIERVRSAGLAGMARFAPCLRVAESQPGEVAEIDYGRRGMLMNPHTGKR